MIGTASIVTNETKDAVFALFEGGILPAPHHSECNSLVDVMNRSFVAFDERWSAIPYTLSFTVEEIEEQHTLVAAFDFYDSINVIDAENFDRAICAYHKPLALAIFDEIDRRCSFGNSIITPARIYELAEYTWFYGSGEEFLLNIGSDILEGKPDRVNPWMQVRKMLRDDGRLTPGALRNALGRHYFRRNRMSNRERQQLIAAAPRPLRGALEAIQDACHSLASLPTPKKVDLYDALSGGISRPTIVFDTTRPWDRVGRGVVGELLDDLDNSTLESGEDYCAQVAVTIDGSAASIRRLRTILVGLDRTWTALRTIASAIESITEAGTR